MKPLLLLFDSDPGRRDELLRALGSDSFHALGVGAETASSVESISPSAIVLSLLSGAELLDLAVGWKSDPLLARIPIAAVVPAEDARASDIAWAAGVDVVLPWPESPSLIAARVRSLEKIVRLQREVAAFERLVVSLVTAFESREPDTFEHGERVARIAVTMGAELGLSRETCDRMRRGALLHDVGTLVLSDRVTQSEAPLDAADLDEIRIHPVAGYELLRGVPSLEPILAFVHRHHERLDGSGFPDGLSGSEIPFPIQVVSIADAYDSMTSSRAYRSVFSREKAMSTLRDEAARGLWNQSLPDTLEKALDLLAAGVGSPG